MSIIISQLNIANKIHGVVYAARTRTETYALFRFAWTVQEREQQQQHQQIGSERFFRSPRLQSLRVEFFASIDWPKLLSVLLNCSIFFIHFSRVFASLCASFLIVLQSEKENKLKAKQPGWMVRIGRMFSVFFSLCCGYAILSAHLLRQKRNFTLKT